MLPDAANFRHEANEIIRCTFQYNLSYLARLGALVEIIVPLFFGPYYLITDRKPQTIFPGVCGGGGGFFEIHKPQK